MNATESRRLRYLVLGGGAVVAEFYLPALSGLDWLGDVWVAEPSKESLDRLTAACPHLKVLQVDFRSALDGARELGIDAVIVALPNALHEAAVTLAIERDLDVLCEKPLAMTQAACRGLSDKAARSGRVLAVGMTRRFMPSTKAIQRVLDAGWIGEIATIEAEDGHNFAWSSESGTYGRVDNAGVLANVGVHMLDLVEHLAGELKPVAYTDDWRGGVEANAQFELETASAVPVQLKFSYTRSLNNGIRIRGTRGDLWLSGDTVHYRDTNRDLDAEVSLRRPYAFGDWPLTFESALREELSDFKDSIVNRRAPCATAQDAARTAALIDWAYSHHTVESLVPSTPVKAAGSHLEPGRMVITGGTGFVGGHLIEALSALGHRDLVVPIRSYQRSANSWRFPVQLQRANLLDRANLDEVMKGSRYVFHLAFGRDGANAARVTIEGTKNVVESAIDAGVECVVILSTTAVFGDPGGGRLVDESFPYDPPNREYERSKAEAERWALARAQSDMRTRIVVINSSCVYGPGGKTFTELPARLLRDDQFCWIEEGRGVANYVYVTNLVDAILLAAGQKDVHGQRFIVSDGSVTWREFFTELFGDEVADLPSHTRAELVALAKQGTPSLRDVARTVVQSGELWRMVGQNPRLATTKAILERMTPGLYRRVKDSRSRSAPSQPKAADRHGTAPVFLDILFGVTTTHLASEKARRSLGWMPAVELEAGQKACRSWLAELGLVSLERA